MAVVLGPNGTRLDLRLSGPGFDWGGWSTDLAQRGVRGVTTDDDPVYGPALRASGLDRQQCTVGRHIRSIDKDDPTHLDRERPPEAGPVLPALWETVL